MDSRDLQMVLDLLVAKYSLISPQILRSAVDCTKMSAAFLQDIPGDDSDGKSSLFLKAEGYIEGYCRVFDKFYNANAIDVPSSNVTCEVMDKISIDFGEEAPTALLAACSSFLEIVSARDGDNMNGELLFLCALGFMDGALEADTEISFNKHIKPMNEPYPQEAALSAYDIVAEEISLDISDKDVAEDIRQTAGKQLANMMRMMVYPKSGNSEFSTGDPLSCALFYLSGYIKGMLGEDSGIDLEQIATPSESQEKALNVAKAYLAMWTQYKGYSSQIMTHAEAAMRDNALSEEIFFNDENKGISEDDAIVMSILFGMGYADGSWFLSQDDDEYDEKVMLQEEISDEIDLLFAGMSFPE